MIVFLSLTMATSAATITVCELGCDTTTIQSAVDLAAPGDIVDVGAGRYSENVLVETNLTLRGAGAEEADAGTEA